MRHPDLQVNDFVDGRLDDDDRERVLAHLAECAHCRRTADDLRLVKNALGALGAVEPPASLLEKLNGIAGPDGPLPVDHDAAPAGMVNVAPWRPVDNRPPARRGPSSPGSAPSHRTPWIDRHRSGVRVAATGMVSAGAMMLVLATIGAPSDGEQPGSVTPASVVPAVDDYMEEHARSTGRLPFVDPASYLTPRTSSFSGGSLGGGQ